MAKVGWEGIEVLDNQAKQETKNEQLEIDKSYARTFETEEGKKCLKHLMSRTLDQPTWVPGEITHLDMQEKDKIVWSEK